MLSATVLRMLPIAIRSMRESDLDTVSELAILANPFTTKENYRKHILSELRNKPDLSFVAIKKTKVVGYVQAEICNDNEAVLEDIAVDKENQGLGIGSCLLENELHVLKNKGIEIVFAEVHYKCASAIPFYYKHGFRITDARQDHFGKGQDAVTLKKILC
jgi:ribosomal protein S18 acetylase RimI-like enzyme